MCCSTSGTDFARCTNSLSAKCNLSIISKWNYHWGIILNVPSSKVHHPHESVILNVQIVANFDAPCVGGIHKFPKDIAATTSFDPRLALCNAVVAELGGPQRKATWVGVWYAWCAQTGYQRQRSWRFFHLQCSFFHICCNKHLILRTFDFRYLLQKQT